MADKKEETKPVETMSRDEIQGLFQQIGGYMKNQNDALVALTRFVQEGNTGGTPPAGGVAPKTEEEVPVDIEKMSRADFGNYLIDKVTKEGLVPLHHTMQQDRDVRTRESLVNQVRDAAASHPDFNKWHVEIKEITKTHPSLNVEEAYQLARNRDTDKSAGIDTELSKAAEEKVAKRAGEEGTVTPIAPKFGGLLPTSGMTAEKEDGEMTPKDAAEAAWISTDLSEHLKAVSDN